MVIERGAARAAIGALGVALSCGGHSARAPEAAPPSGTAAALLPLLDGTVLAYDTEAEPSGERGVVVLQIRRPRPGLVELDDGGEVRRLEIDSAGVRFSTGGYWLKEPLDLGRCWQGRSGQVCVSAIGLAVTVPAGRFEDCVETVERGPRSSRVKSVFCPGVGMVLLDVSGESDGEPARERASLRSHGPRVDVNAL